MYFLRPMPQRMIAIFAIRGSPLYSAEKLRRANIRFRWRLVRDSKRAETTMAGAGGIEPPNGGIKIRCLTAWLRPNRPFWERRKNKLPQISRRTAGLSRGGDVF